MRIDPRTPVIVGAGQITQRPGQSPGQRPIQRPGQEGSQGPIGLAVEALRRAGEDSGTGDLLLRRAGSIRHVATISGAYPNEAALIAEALGASPRETVRTTPFGGDASQRLLGDTAAAIARGELDVALVSGAEAVASALALQRSGADSNWPEQAAGEEPSWVLGNDRVPSNDAEQAVGLIAPLYTYALLESAIRRRTGADPQSHLRAVAELWSRCSEVAAANPYAWIPERRGADELLEVTAANRLVSAPYTKLMTANLQVDLASGLIVCSAAAAEAAGVPRERWVFVCSAAHAEEEWFLSERDELATSPAIAAAGEAALGQAGVEIDEVAHVDLYSCFPSAVQIAAAELKLPIDDPGRPLTVTGGLTFAGGPGNNYAGHAIATMVGRLRGDTDGFGLVTALGWFLSKHAIGVYSSQPPSRPFLEIDAGAAMQRPAPRRARSDYAGPATVEAFTVPFARDGSPEVAIVSAIAPDGTRALLRTGDPETIEAILGNDPVGRDVEIAGPGSLAF